MNKLLTYLASSCFKKINIYIYIFDVTNFTRIHGKRSSLTSLSLFHYYALSVYINGLGKVYYLTPCLVTVESIGEKSIMRIVYDYDPQLAQLEPIESPLCNWVY
jgi:hypothetical protein